MKMTPGLRKLALTAHVSCSVGLLGTIATFLVLALAGLNVQDERAIRAAYWAMDLTARSVIVPLALASLLTGLVQSLGTAWGLFRHYWVVAKLLITAFATLVLLIKLELIGEAAHLATQTPLPYVDLRPVGIELAVHAVAGLLVLLAPSILSVYKPRGVTPYGRRKQPEQRAPWQRPYRSPISASADSNAGAGVWVRGGLVTMTFRRGHVFGITVAVLVLHVLILHLTGVQLGGH